MKYHSDSNRELSSIASKKPREIASKESFRTFNRALLILFALTSSSAILSLSEVITWHFLLVPLLALLIITIAYCVIFLGKMKSVNL
ncbi:MAG: hypothetical protein ACXABY_11085 [Candidatus Thorarchaeota archaeon]